ncbi:molybdopterin-guanine dinucleotide biosynthesis protein B [Methylobacter sp. S3L5C]|uniref:molybdopterin-guanine dinucleotide biosynthesis protein B n=1 Tax=Methylobacter sp. S3L5C TaxID=2839024 RepID=UPI001FADF251|nr:molybdopterin-guanine dinucleotide biosynthesis protein B [Methylobacter sp. S3L5C]UOA10579.1 molybdopterin-guanine dinucleotide biosynthesis protein B [Methylobacter sp. S3L5C]
MQNAHVPILGFAAFSGTGKTTLLTQIIPILKQYGLRIGLIKHSHHSFQIDQPGKDSFRLREAGASPVMLVSTHRRAMITEITPEQEPRLDDQLKLFDQSALDLILVEGFKAEQFPKIELHRPSLNKSLLYPNDPNIIAIATDEAVEIPNTLTWLDINQPEMIADFILQQFMRHL